MKKAIVLFVALWLFVPSTVAGEIRVYDDNDQYLGIAFYSDIGIMYLVIFIPTLNSFAVVDFDTGLIYPGDTGEGPILFYTSGDCSGTPYSSGLFVSGGSNFTPQFFSKSDSGGNRIFKLGGTPITFSPRSIIINFDAGCESTSGGTVTEIYEAVEILPQDFPFTIPVALPLRYEYVGAGIKGDYNNDGDVDASDLSAFSGDFGK